MLDNVREEFDRKRVPAYEEKMKAEEARRAATPCECTNKPTTTIPLVRRHTLATLWSPECM